MASVAGYCHNITSVENGHKNRSFSIILNGISDPLLVKIIAGQLKVVLK